MGKIICKWSIFHSYVKLPEGKRLHFANWKPWSIEIDGLPFLKRVIFSVANC